MIESKHYNNLNFESRDFWIWECLTRLTSHLGMSFQDLGLATINDLKAQDILERWVKSSQI